MNSSDRRIAIQNVQHELTKSDFTDLQVQNLMKKYQVLLDQWLIEYLETGSHLTPADFAAEITQAEQVRRFTHD